MPTSVITYEYPLNERIRTYLRLERLFSRLSILVKREDSIDHHFALTTLFEIMDVAARADLKMDVLKDLERQKQVLSAYRGNPSISMERLEPLIESLTHWFNALSALPGKAGHGLNKNEWLMAIRSRSAIPGGTCEFDLPSYFAWRQGPAAIRQSELSSWISVLVPLAESVRLLLDLIRQSGAPQKISVLDGQFQQTFAQGRICQLVRVSMQAQSGVIPEISGNRLVLSLRLMHRTDGDRFQIYKEESTAEITLCG